MRLIDADSLINAIENSYLTAGEKRLFKIKVNKAPTVEITEEEIQKQLNARCMSVVANEYLITLHNNRPTAEEINERLINEYISKVKCCDECFAFAYCAENGLRKSRVPQDYCVKNIKCYFLEVTP